MTPIQKPSASESLQKPTNAACEVWRWLRSLFCTGFCPERQRLETFQLLLDTVLQAPMI